MTNLADKTVIVTTTIYNPDVESDRIRSNLALQMIHGATDMGYRVLVADGGSSQEFLRELERYGTILMPWSSRVMGQHRRQIIQAAYDTGMPYIAWTEPEKKGYELQIEKTARPLEEGLADMTLARRKSHDSYPRFQVLVETAANEFWKRLSGRDDDLWFSPKTWKRDVSRYFLNYSGEVGDRWESLYVPIVDAIADGRRVLSVPVDFEYPPEQKRIEENNLDFDRKRIAQLFTITDALQRRWEQHYPRQASTNP